jgi:hypothetical protein
VVPALPFGETAMPKFNLSISGISIAMAVALAIWEVFFFFYGWEGLFSLFVPNQLGFHLAWMNTIYLSFQLVSIPFALRAAKGRFIGIVDGMASLLPLLIVVVVIFGRSHLLNTPERWEAAFLLMLVTATDLFGGYAFNIALSRRMFNVTGGMTG